MADLSAEEMRERIRALEEQVYPESMSNPEEMPLGSAENPADPVHTEFVRLKEQAEDPGGEAGLRGLFIDSNGILKKVNQDGTTGTVSGAPSSAEFVLLSDNADIPNARTLSAGANVDTTDDGSSVTVGVVDGQGSGLDADTVQGSSPPFSTPKVQKTLEAITFRESVVSLSRLNGSITEAGGRVFADEYSVKDASYNTTEAIGGTGPDNIFDISWNDDGTKFYICNEDSGDFTSDIYTYTCSTAYDISTRDNGTEYNIDTNADKATGMSWGDNGTKFIVSDDDTAELHLYNCSTAYDLSTRSYQSTASVAEISNQSGVAWNDDGTKFFLVGTDGLVSYTMSSAYDIMTASVKTNTGNISGNGIVFSTNGLKMYVADEGNSEIVVYTLADPYDISTAERWDIMDTVDEGGPSGVAWNGDGSKIYTTVNVDQEVNSYDTPTNLPGKAVLGLPAPTQLFEWDFVTYQESPDGGSVTVDVVERPSKTATGPQSSTVGGVAYNGDGSKLYIVNVTDSVESYTLSTAYDPSTATAANSFSVASEDDYVQGIEWDNTGERMYVLGRGTDSIYEYSLSTAYDISTASLNQSGSVDAGVGYGTNDGPQGATWNDDGTELTIAYTDNSVRTFSLSTAYDVSTLSLEREDAFNLEAIYGVLWNDTGSKLFVTDNPGGEVVSYNCSTPYDITTRTRVDNFSTEDEDEFPRGLAWNADGSELTVSGRGTNRIYAYSLIADYSITETLISNVSRNEDISSLSDGWNRDVLVTFDGTEGTNSPALDYVAAAYTR
mgnify:CR=1 FL=1